MTAVGDDFVGGAGGGGEDGEAVAHGFEVDDAEAFVGEGRRARGGGDRRRRVRRRSTRPRRVTRAPVRRQLSGTRLISS